MEPNPRSFIVGLFIVCLLAAGTIFVFWYSKFNVSENQAIYQINFRDSVTGLRENEAVLYNGIPIGRVLKIRVDRKDVEEVKVLISVHHPSLIRENSRASIEAKGLTGLTFVQITGSTQDSPVLSAKVNQKYPIIKSESSSVEALFTEAPKILKRLTSLTAQLEKFFDDQMIKDTHAAIGGLRQITNDLNKGPHALPKVFADLQTSLKSLAHTSKIIGKLVEENRPAIDDFTQQSLPALSKMIESLENTSQSFNRIVSEIDRSPGWFLHKNFGQGVPIENP